MPIAPTLHPDIVEAERLGNQIAELSAHIEVAGARLLDLIREFDDGKGWAHAGAKSARGGHFDVAAADRPTTP
jgi:hypothetical protein